MTGTSTFKILVAIDLQGGDVVRLRQGDFEQVTRYATDPVTLARSLVQEGARWLHVVDLDGARAGRPVHSSTIADMIAAVGASANVEVAGGLRTVAAAQEAIDAGAARVVLGTAALRDPDMAARAVDRFGEDRVAVALDLRGGTPVADGWIRRAGATSAADALLTLVGRGVTTFEVTAVERDGMLEGPDVDSLRPLIAIGGRIIASGGITTLGDLRTIRDIGCAGAIVGRAVYERRLDLTAVASLF